jgi:hypothetical protein
MNKKLIFLAALVLVGCAHRAPQQPRWAAVTDQTEAEYDRFKVSGKSTLAGQAFLTQQNGGVVKAAGRTVTLDPVTSTSENWWYQAGRVYARRFSTPPSAGFTNARRSVTADADGRFKFTDLPAGSYYVRTEVTWEIGGYHPTQGGLVGKRVDIGENESKDVILNSMP